MRLDTVCLLVGLVVCVGLCISEASRDTDRRRQKQREERRKISAGKEDDTEEMSPSNDKTDSDFGRSNQREEKESGRKRKNERPEGASSSDRKEKKKKEEEEEDDKDDDKKGSTTPTPLNQTLLVDMNDELLMNGYVDLERDTKCVNIPRNMSMCQNIGYSKMRLPNLLHHSTLTEVVQGSRTWTPLLHSSCHPDTELFLCSLFSPVCLDQTIFPCRSLCEVVKTGCEGLMGKHGYKWPDMLSCDKLPSDNDLCIMAQSGKNQSSSNKNVNSAATSKNGTVYTVMRNHTLSSSKNTSVSILRGNGTDIIKQTAARNTTEKGERRMNGTVPEDDTSDNRTCMECRQIAKFSELQEKYCAADFVVKMRASKLTQTGNELMITANKNVKFLKEPPSGVKWEGQDGRRSKSTKLGRSFYLSNASQCNCLLMSGNKKGGQYLLMGRLQRSVSPGAGTYRMLISYVAEYKSPVLKRALRGLTRNDRCPTGGEPSTGAIVKPKQQSGEESEIVLGQKNRLNENRRLKKLERKDKKARRRKVKPDGEDELDKDMGTGNGKKDGRVNKKKLERQNKRKSERKEQTGTDTEKANKKNRRIEKRAEKERKAREQEERRIMKQRKRNNKRERNNRREKISNEAI